MTALLRVKKILLHFLKPEGGDEKLSPPTNTPQAHTHIFAAHRIYYGEVRSSKSSSPHTHESVQKPASTHHYLV